MNKNEFLLIERGNIKMKDKYENKANCNLTTCRYNADGKCTNEGKRKECIEVARKVLCEDETT